MAESSNSAGKPDPSSVAHRPSVVYNLEKDPLQTGRIDRTPSFLRSLTGYLGALRARRLSWHTAIAGAFLLFLFLFLLLEYALGNLVSNWLAQWRNG